MIGPQFPRETYPKMAEIEQEKKFNSVAVDLLGSSDDFKICLAPVKLDVDDGLFDEFLPVSLFEISDAHCSRQSYVIPSQCKKVHNGQTLASFCTQFF